MTATLEFGPPGAVAGRATLVPLAARELRRFVLNPVFLFAVVMAEWITWTGGGGTTTEIDEVNGYPAVFLGGFGMMAAYWLTRSMRASEPVAGVTPTSRPARTAALCAVAIVPFFCGVLTLFGFLHSYPAGDVGGPSSDTVWWIVLAVCVAAIAISVGGPSLPRWRASVVIPRRPDARTVMPTGPGIEGDIPGTSLSKEVR